MNKVLGAKLLLGLVGLVGLVIALFILYWIGAFLVWWAGAEIVSFSIIIGLISLGLLVLGAGIAVDWSLGVLKEVKKTEEEAQRENAQEKKLAAYSNKWGEGAVPSSYGGVTHWDLPPKNL